jgi:type III secretion protein U
MSDEKTEQPTDKKLEDSRKKGQLPQRKNVLEATILTLGVLYVAVTWKRFAKGIGGIFDVSIVGITKGLAESRTAFYSAFVDATSYSVIFMIALAIFVLIFNLVLTKFNFAPESMSPKFEKFNPISGLKGIFSKSTVYSFIRLIIFFSSASLTLIFTIMTNIGDIVSAGACGISCISVVLPRIIIQTVAIILLILLIMAYADFKVQTMLFISQSKMSKDEVKREHKGSQGDPMIKSARKQIANDDANLPTMQEISHVIYSNSVLVALIYREGTTPFVVMKTKGGGVPRLLQKLRSVGATCVNLPLVAAEFHKLGNVGAYMDKRSAKGMAKVLQRIKQQAGSL